MRGTQHNLNLQMTKVEFVGKELILNTRGRAFGFEEQCADPPAFLQLPAVSLSIGSNPFDIVSKAVEIRISRFCPHAAVVISSA